MSSQPPLFEKIKQQYGKYPKPLMVNLEVAKTMDRKTQTRRLIKDQNLIYTADGKIGTYEKPIWEKGDALWVREPAKVICNYLKNGMHQTIDFSYLSDGKIETIYVPRQHKNKKWVQNHQGIPNGCIKEMARTFLRVTNVSVEKLQDISEYDIHNEGIRCPIPNMWSEDKRKEYKRYAWKQLWNRTAKIGCLWEDNPYVFVYEFEKVEVLG